MPRIESDELFDDDKVSYKKDGSWIITPGRKRKVLGWKSRIYKKFKTIREFVVFLKEKDIHLNEKQFSAWLNGHNRPYTHYFEAVEGKLRELGV